jgi:hypothetical protein
LLCRTCLSPEDALRKRRGLLPEGREDSGASADISGVKHHTEVTRNAFHLEKEIVNNFTETEAKSIAEYDEIMLYYGF